MAVTPLNSLSCAGKPSGLLQILPRLLERYTFGVFTRCTLGARKTRAGVDVVYRAVVGITHSIRDEVDGPGVDRLVAFRVLFRSHSPLPIRYGFSTGAPTRLPHSVHEPS